jgi:hypothetical protein
VVPDAPLHDLLWTVPTAPPSVAAAVHHRAFILRIGFALPGARMVESIADLEGVQGRWVIKAPLSASGRDRYIHREGEKDRSRITRLFERHGPLLFEPWMERTEDFGVAALLLPSETRVVSFHRLRVDRRGQFTGIDLMAGVPPEPLAEAVDAVARALRTAGYLGPFGIDAWRYRRPDGSIAWNPLGEINARMTFGLVARALAERLGLAGVRLTFGREIPDGAIPLLLPGRDGSGAAWLSFAHDP